MKKLALIISILANNHNALAINYYDIRIINNTDHEISHSGGRHLFDNGDGFELSGSYPPHTKHIYHLHDEWWLTHSRHNADQNRIWTNIDLPSRNGIHSSRLLIDNPQIGRTAIYVGYSEATKLCGDIENMYYEFPKFEEYRAATLTINPPATKDEDYSIVFQAGRRGNDGLYESSLAVSQLYGLSYPCVGHHI